VSLALTSSFPLADYIGGHIKGAQNVPSRSLDAMLPTLVRKLQHKDTVVFHCALSQQRGPSAALRYIRERERLLPSDEAAAEGSVAARGGEKDETAEGANTKPMKQKVVVLDRGFVGWQEEYGTDERLTEGYRKELWEDGYWM
jgi:rhodanese-related sulfurtransferase